MTREHHFEVIVPVDDDGPGLPYLNGELSAYWSSGTVYDTGANDEDGEWVSADEHWDDDLAAGDIVARVLALPDDILAIYKRNTDSDGWDIGIMDEIATLLRGLGYEDEVLT